MKRYLMISILLIIFGAGCSVTNQEIISESTQNSEIREYEVFGMDCPGCHGGLEKLVKKIPAVQDAQANWEKQLLTVLAKPDIELHDDDIYDAIRRANFTVGKRIR